MKTGDYLAWEKAMGFDQRPDGCRAVATALGVSRETVRCWRRGKARPNRVTGLAMAALASGLGPWSPSPGTPPT